MPVSSTSPAAKTITIVSGLPRSGTSLMMQCLEAGGLPVVSDQVRLPDEDNPRGYFECEAVKLLSGSAEGMCMEQLRGRAVKMAHLLLYHLPFGGPYRIIVMRREIDEIIASQDIMLKRRGKCPLESERPMLTDLFVRELDVLDKWLRRRCDLTYEYV